LLIAALIVLSTHLVLGRGLIEPRQVGLARFIPYTQYSYGHCPAVEVNFTGKVVL
jgi:hypothetical protein